MNAMRTIKRLVVVFVRPSSFKVGLVVIAVCCMPLFWESRAFHGFVRSVDYRAHDFMFRMREMTLGPMSCTGKVVIVDLDEKSLAEEGQWPWPRDRVACLLRAIGSDGPKVIGLDIVFAERDRTSLTVLLPRLQALTGAEVVLPAGVGDNDVLLGEAIAETPTIVGYYFLMESDGLLRDRDFPLPEFSFRLESIEEGMLRLSDFPVAYRPVLNVGPVCDEALSEGFFNTVSDVDGIVRRGDLFIQFRDTLYPSLALEMLREGAGTDPELVFSESIGVSAVQLGQTRIPVNRQCQVSINFRGGPRTLDYVSATDVLRRRIPEGYFADKYVLVGTSATGLLDLRATPISRAFPGVEVNGTIIDNVLAGDFMVYDQAMDASLSFTVLLVCGLLLNAVLAYMGPRTGALTGALILLGLVAGNYRHFFLNHRLVGMSLPLGALVVLFIVVTVANYFFEGRRKRFIQGAFSHYVSDNVVTALLKHPEKLTLEGEEKVLTVMFSDIRGFTTISEGMDARQLSSFLNEYMTAMTDVVMEHHGTVDKFIGDAIMAIWGAPLDDPDHAVNAVDAALRMLVSLGTLAPMWTARGLPEIDIGIGVNTGRVRVGNMGSRSRFDYTVLGDDVNLASRLEGLNKEYGTHALLTEATRNAIEGKIFCRPVDRVRVKGKVKPVDIWEPLCVEPAPASLIEETGRLSDALAAFRERDFSHAKGIFVSLNEKQPEALYQVYLTRINLFESVPPPPGWDGVSTFTSK